MQGCVRKSSTSPCGHSWFLSCGLQGSEAGMFGVFSLKNRLFGCKPGLHPETRPQVMAQSGHPGPARLSSNSALCRLERERAQQRGAGQLVPLRREVFGRAHMGGQVSFRGGVLGQVLTRCPKCATW